MSWGLILVLFSLNVYKSSLKPYLFTRINLSKFCLAQWRPNIGLVTVTVTFNSDVVWEAWVDYRFNIIGLSELFMSWQYSCAQNHTTTLTSDVRGVLILIKQPTEYTFLPDFPAARDTDPMLASWWSSVADVGPTWSQYWVGVSCL